jgi:hypothetical protein
MADLILDADALILIKQRLASYADDPGAVRDEPDRVEQLAQDAARLLADLETMRHRVDQAAVKTRQASLWLDGRAHTAADPR